jgi:hypothetical protein
MPPRTTNAGNASITTPPFHYIGRFDAALRLDFDARNCPTVRARIGV